MEQTYQHICKVEDGGCGRTYTSLEQDTMLIPLTQGMFAKVDKEDFESLSKFKWYAHKIGQKSYAARMTTSVGRKRGLIHMHRQILGLPTNKVVDHIDGNGLNNSKSNIRLCSRAENLRNRGRQVNNTSGYSGVAWNKRHRYWEVYIKAGGGRIRLGYFRDKIDAINARMDGAYKYHKEFAYKYV